MRRVILESPYAASNIFLLWKNVKYARRCVKNSLLRGESPIVSHLLYTQRGILIDSSAEQRHMGIAAGHAWIGVADAMVVYDDRGISPGMKLGIKVAEHLCIPIEYRSLKGWS